MSYWSPVNLHHARGNVYHYNNWQVQRQGLSDLLPRRIKSNRTYLDAICDPGLNTIVRKFQDAKLYIITCKYNEEDIHSIDKLLEIFSRAHFRYRRLMGKIDAVLQNSYEDDLECAQLTELLREYQNGTAKNYARTMQSIEKIFDQAKMIAHLPISTYGTKLSIAAMIEKSGMHRKMVTLESRLIGACKSDHFA